MAKHKEDGFGIIHGSRKTLLEERVNIAISAVSDGTWVLRGMVQDKGRTKHVVDNFLDTGSLCDAIKAMLDGAEEDLMKIREQNRINAVRIKKAALDEKRYRFRDANRGQGE